MKDKLDSLTERFVQDLRAAVVGEFLKLLENIVTVPTTLKDEKKTKKKKKKKTNKKDLEYQRAWRLTQKLKAGKTISPEDTKWHNEYLKKRKK